MGGSGGGPRAPPPLLHRLWLPWIRKQTGATWRQKRSNPGLLPSTHWWFWGFKGCAIWLFSVHRAACFLGPKFRASQHSVPLPTCAGPLLWGRLTRSFIPQRGLLAAARPWVLRGGVGQEEGWPLSSVPAHTRVVWTRTHTHFCFGVQGTSPRELQSKCSILGVGPGSSLFAFLSGPEWSLCEMRS